MTDGQKYVYHGFRKNMNQFSTADLDASTVFNTDNNKKSAFLKNHETLKTGALPSQE